MPIGVLCLGVVDYGSENKVCVAQSDVMGESAELLRADETLER